MAINRKTFNRIKGLLKDGISIELALTMIITLSDSPAEAARTIIEFFTPPKQFEPLNEIQIDTETVKPRRKPTAERVAEATTETEDSDG
jgi:hypothetical protein